MVKKVMALLLVFFCLIPMQVFAADAMSSTDLIDQAKEYDGQQVVYTGEVVGDILNRGEYTWINVSDGSNAIGIWIKSSDVKSIAYVGRYGTQGDTVRLTGVFHRACADHGGDLDIHADKIEIIKKGNTVSHPVNLFEVILAFALFAAALLLTIYLLKKHFKKGKSE